MYAYCNNNPVARVDDSGYMWQFVPALDPANFVYGSADGLPFAGGSSGYFKTSFDSSAYNTYQIRTKVTSYNASLGGYYYGGGSSFGGYTSQFAVGGKVSVTDNMATSGGKGIKTINHDIIDLPRVGSSLKSDAYHNFPDIIDNYVGFANKFQLSNATLYQLQGSYRGQMGRFEWIVQDFVVTHRLFVRGGTINGLPTKP